MSGCSYREFVRIERVEGVAGRYTVREMEGFPPATILVDPWLGRAAPVPAERDFRSLVYRSDQPPSIVLRKGPTGTEPENEQRCRCYRFTMDGPQPVSVPCESFLKTGSTGVDYDPAQFRGGMTQRDRGRLEEAQLELVVSEDAERSSWGGGFFGGVKGPFRSRMDVFDTRQGQRIFSLTTTKGLWNLETAWFAVGKRARIVTLLSPTHTVVIDIHPAP